MTANNKDDLKETRKRWLPTVTTFSPRDSQSELCSPLGLPKEFAQMEQKLKEMHTQEDDSLFYYHSSEDLANALLDDIDYHFNKVKCRKIEGLMPRLMKMAEGEMGSFPQRGNR